MGNTKPVGVAYSDPVLTEVTVGTATISPTEMAYLDGVVAGTQAAGKAVVPDSNVNIGVVKATQLHIGATGSEIQVNATPAEINNACDISERGQTLTVSGAITAGKSSILLNHTSVVIAATIADASLHGGIFSIKAGLEPGGGADHTATITTGTWNGTNKVATFADINDALVVFFDHAGNGTIITNTGSVSLSG